jgi:hypothetical protein
MPVDIPPQEGGFLHLLPIYLKAGFTAESVTGPVLPWGTPSIMSIEGYDADGRTRPLVYIGYEWPAQWVRPPEPIDQQNLEWLHVQRFRSDHVLATRQHPFVDVRPGDDPPDVVVTDLDGSMLGLECTRFTIESRLEAHGLFQAVRRRLGQANPAQFTALAGQVVYLWFNEDDSALAKPHRTTDEEAAAELVLALADYRPEPYRMWIDTSAPMPDPAPQLPLHMTDAGAAFYSVPMINAVPDSVLYSNFGFELGLAYTTSHAAEAEAEKLSRQVARKDRSGTDWLLISAGAPDNYGITYPSEELLADFVCRRGQLKVDPKHLTRITVHFWSSGRAVEAWPEQRELFGPLYEGSTPGHHVVAASVPSAPTSDLPE